MKYNLKNHWIFCLAYLWEPLLTHWGRVTHICVSKLTIIGSHNGLSPGRRQAIIWTNAEILLIGPLGTHFNETSIEIHTFSFKKIHLKLSSGKWRPFCLGLNVLIHVSERVPRPQCVNSLQYPIMGYCSLWTSDTIYVNSLRLSDAICISKPTIISSDNGLAPGRRQAIIQTNAGILLIGPL